MTDEPKDSPLKGVDWNTANEPCGLPVESGVNLNMYVEEPKHSPLLKLTGTYKTALGIGVYTEPIKDLQAPEILCETLELADLVLRRVNQGPKVDALLEIAAKLSRRIAEEGGGKLLDEEYWDDTVELACEFLKAKKED